MGASVSQPGGQQEPGAQRLAEAPAASRSLEAGPAVPAVPAGADGRTQAPPPSAAPVSMPSGSSAAAAAPADASASTSAAHVIIELSGVAQGFPLHAPPDAVRGPHATTAAGGEARAGGAAAAHDDSSVGPATAGGAGPEAAAGPGAAMGECRICLDPFTAEDVQCGRALALGCACKSTLAGAHLDCALRWFSTRPDGRCEICGQQANSLKAYLCADDAEPSSRGPPYTTPPGGLVPGPPAPAPGPPPGVLMPLFCPSSVTPMGRLQYALLLIATLSMFFVPTLCLILFLSG